MMQLTMVLSFRTKFQLSVINNELIFFSQSQESSSKVDDKDKDKDVILGHLHSHLS